MSAAVVKRAAVRNAAGAASPAKAGGTKVVSTRAARVPTAAAAAASARRPVAAERAIRPAARPRPATAAARNPMTAPGGAAAPTDAAAKHRRRVLVAGGLVATLTVTSALLLAMQPAPLAPDAVKSLMSLTAPDDIKELLQTRVPVQANRWKFIYVHHSGSAGGTAAEAGGGGTAAPLADHFVIGNGEGSGDGEVQVGQRWNAQQSAGRTRGLDRVDPDCISVCLVGDLDQAPPTPRQMDQLSRLVTSLQSKLQVDRERVWVVDAPQLPAGCGRYFPREAFRNGLLP